VVSFLFAFRAGSFVPPGHASVEVLSPYPYGSRSLWCFFLLFLTRRLSLSIGFGDQLSSSGKARVLHAPSLVAVASPPIPMLAVTVFLLFVCVYFLVSLYFTVYLCNRQIFIGLICNEALKVFM